VCSSRALALPANLLAVLERERQSPKLLSTKLVLAERFVRFVLKIRGCVR